MKLSIIHQEKNWIVINKPSGLSVHNAEDDSNVLIVLQSMGLKDFNPVHRLDKATSGIMILSNDSKTINIIQDSLKERAKKSYFAVVKGKVKDSGTWNQDLTNKAEGRKNPQGIKSARVKASTEFKCLKQNQYLSLLKITLQTGRQHQIRKHCVLNKHQIIGDQRYGERKYNQLIQKKYGFTDMALHSGELIITINGKEYKFNAPLEKDWEGIFFP